MICFFMNSGAFRNRTRSRKDLLYSSIIDTRSRVCQRLLKISANNAASLPDLNQPKDVIRDSGSSFFLLWPTTSFVLLGIPDPSFLMTSSKNQIPDKLSTAKKEKSSEKGSKQNQNIVRSVRVENYGNRDKSRTSTKLGRKIL